MSGKDEFTVAVHNALPELGGLTDIVEAIPEFFETQAQLAENAATIEELQTSLADQQADIMAHMDAAALPIDSLVVGGMPGTEAHHPDFSDFD